MITRHLPSFWTRAIAALLVLFALTGRVTADTTHDYFRTDYGQRIGDKSAQASVWWCDATRKIPPTRSVPTDRSDSAKLAAAKNDFEAVQIVVHAKENVRRLMATARVLQGPDGAAIAAEQIQILRVAYHLVHTPTDSAGVRGRWPDALPPLTEPVDVPAGENQPLWVLVHVPADATAGDYLGQIALEADGWSVNVPIALHVWDFALPKRNHIETAFGFSAGSVAQYHQLKTEDERRKVLDLYWKTFSEHRISPYDPAPLDPMRVEFMPEANPPRAEVDFSRFDNAMLQAADRFHFTNFRLRLQGMGGGTFHARQVPEIEGFGEETTQYQAMCASYLSQVESHLDEKGWLDMAYVYWFDEPAPRDYEFVKGGMTRLKKYAPRMQRMLTEEPRDELAGAVDIWCPLSSNYEDEPADARRKQGERFWWYVCTGPKAPYCTLFIDHPATELRVWLWQSWQRDIVGILVWQSNYWTSSAAYPDTPQNPYEDPMGWRSGYSTPRGEKRPWGNGDGRFIYPPLSAAEPGVPGTGAVLDPPVASIRWEMLREGIEDYELLYLLRSLLKLPNDRLAPDDRARFERLLRVPETITSDMTHFTTDPTPIYNHRREIAEAIEQLTPSRD